MNFPFPAGSGREEFWALSRHRWLRRGTVPAGLAGDLGGVRSRLGDPLGRFTLTDRDFAELTRA